jgi:hypothetical protein
MRRRRVQVALAITLSTSGGAAAAALGCSAVNGRAPPQSGDGGAGGGAVSASRTGSAGGAGGGAASASGTGGLSSINLDASLPDAAEEVAQNPCGTECGPTELCDPAHTGLDDNCNGVVDEGCPCTPGQAHWCFEGDPAYRNAPGCFDGTEICTELGFWGPCTGGVQATPPDNCYLNDTSACHAITTTPFADVHLQTGTGQFSANAVAGSESYAVQCPAGVSQCPAVVPLDEFEPLQSGQYTVTYTKSVAGVQGPMSCTYPLIVGAPGLRVELSWEHTTADMGVDLDLHLHEPLDPGPWGVSPSVPQDCCWSNCKLDSLMPPQAQSSPHWFPDANVVPQPVNWDNTAIPANNTCYNIPRGIGMAWQTLGIGCHNPRLDIDNIQCDFSVTDPSSPDFCTPENINVDYPPTGQWFRVGVHYYYNHGRTYDVHPEIKVFCNGALSADLGPQGFSMPAAPVTFTPADGVGTGSGNIFWVVADVAFTSDTCGNSTCTVQPVYADPTNLTPYLTLDTSATAAFAPAWPPPP